MKKNYTQSSQFLLKRSLFFTLLFISLSINIGFAQVAQFKAYEIEPFGLNLAPDSGKGYESKESKFVDMDNDGDLDLVIFGVTSDTQGYVGGFIGWQVNSGSISEPQFNGEVIDLLYFDTQTHLNMAVGDFDMDNDIDVILLNSYGTNTIMYKNVGTSEEPKFDADKKVSNVLNQENNYDFTFGISAADLDNDNDLDIVLTGAKEWNEKTKVIMIENTSTDNIVSFNSEANVLLTLDDLDDEIIQTTFFDLDGDGDLDCLFNNPTSPVSVNYYYAKNNGDSQNPQFADYEKNPFNLYKHEMHKNFSDLQLVDIDNNKTIDLFVNGGYDEETIQDYKLLFFENTIILDNEETQLKANMILSPNPNNGAFQIDIPNASKIEIYNHIGQLIYHEDNPTKLMNLRNILSKGHFVVKVFNGNSISTTQMIVF